MLNNDKNVKKRERRWKRTLYSDRFIAAQVQKGGAHGKDIGSSGGRVRTYRIDSYARGATTILEISRVIRLFEANGEVDRSRRSLERERMARDRKPDTFVETF